ncbi:dTDP-4-dehydrorhamnose 3,5-epimerase family protein, partial [Bacillus paralicheniformis]
MKVMDTNLADVKLIEMDVFGDHRGFFTESYSKEKFAEEGIDYDFVQD